MSKSLRRKRQAEEDEDEEEEEEEEEEDEEEGGVEEEEEGKEEGRLAWLGLRWWEGRVVAGLLRGIREAPFIFSAKYSAGV